jgi:hypothetical protein
MHDLLHPLCAIIKDLAEGDFRLQNSLLLDLGYLSTLEVAVLERVVLLDFPTYEKVVSKAISTKVISYDDIPRSCRHETGAPLFGGLLYRVFNELTGQLDCFDPNAVFYLRSILVLLKKLRIPPMSGSVEEAIAEYVRIDASLPSPSLDWSGDVLNGNDPEFLGASPFSFEDLPQRFPGRELSGLSMNSVGWLLDRVFRRVVPASFPDVSELVPRHGPGAVCDLASGEDKYSFPHWPWKLEGSAL